MFFKKKTLMPTAENALPGRADPIPTALNHYVFNRPLKGPYPDGAEMAMFGLGCFWGAERKFWLLETGIWTTAVGYAAGFTPNPTYEEVCTGLTGHNEVVQVVFESAKVSYQELLKTFFESHDPTQGMRQGNDMGTQYRSGIYCYGEAQRQAAETARATYAPLLLKRGFGAITTEIVEAPEFYYAEDYHQQYLAKVPHGYCGLGGTGIACPLPTGIEAK
ncbi:MAG: peptide-methionine (S)-S-oxide reductase MsrA [Hyphomicrobiaceae bacterium]